MKLASGWEWRPDSPEDDPQYVSKYGDSAQIVLTGSARVEVLWVENGPENPGDLEETTIVPTSVVLALLVRHYGRQRLAEMAALVDLGEGDEGMLVVELEEADGQVGLGFEEDDHG